MKSPFTKYKRYAHFVQCNIYIQYNLYNNMIKIYTKQYNLYTYNINTA